MRLSPLPLVWFAWPLWGQCSDAGICALDRAAPDGGNRLALIGQVGRSGSPEDLTFSVVQLEGQFRVGKRTTYTALLPWVRVRGPQGSTSGIGDAILGVSFAFAEGKWGSLSAQLGARFATGDDDQGGLPQCYQPGLGSTDPMAGLRWDGLAWEAGLGYQWARQRSGNSVGPLRRGDDLLAYGGTRGQLGGMAWGLKTLAIQRLSRSDVRDSHGRIVPVPDSGRLQVNLEGTLSWPMSRRWSLESRAAVPFLKRPDNTDGLKRALTVELGAAIRY